MGSGLSGERAMGDRGSSGPRDIRLSVEEEVIVSSSMATAIGEPLLHAVGVERRSTV